MAYKKSIEQMYEEKHERIELRCAIKDKNIAFFNSINSAIQMTNAGKSIKDNKDQKWTEILIDWRDWFYGQWEKWYLRETMPQAINMKKAVAMGNEFKKKLEKRAESDTEFNQAKSELQEAEDIEKANRDLADIPVIEEPEWTGENQAEQSFNNKLNK